MNRFKRIEELRRLKEQAAGAAFQRARKKEDELRAQVKQLHEETHQAEDEARAEIGAKSHRISYEVYGNYYRGQQWREQQVNQKIGKAMETVKQTQEEWQMAERQVRQAERMAEIEEKRLRKERERAEMKVLDELGSMRFNRNKREES